MSSSDSTVIIDGKELKEFFASQDYKETLKKPKKIYIEDIIGHNVHNLLCIPTSIFYRRCMNKQLGYFSMDVNYSKSGTIISIADKYRRHYEENLAHYDENEVVFKYLKQKNKIFFIFHGLANTTSPIKAKKAVENSFKLFIKYLNGDFRKKR